MRISIYARFLRVLWNHLGDKEKFRIICYRLSDKLVKDMERLDEEEELKYIADKRKSAEEEKKRIEEEQNKKL